MSNDNEEPNFNTFSIKREECEKCGATWINGQHVWRGTGASGDSSELDLAGLVCNNYGDDQCINPMKGKDGGQTWEYRSGYIDGMISERKKILDQLNDFD